MSDIIASPLGYGLPYSSLFSVPKAHPSKRRPAGHFWDKAVAPPLPAPAAPEIENELLATQTNSTWLDADTAAYSESEDETPNRRIPNYYAKKTKNLSRIRQIAFRAFVPKAGSNKQSTVVATEIISQQKLVKLDSNGKGERRSGFAIFNSWRIKSKGANTYAKKMVAVVRLRISSKSPEEDKPKTWEEYHRSYAAERIDVFDPPMPPMGLDGDKPSAFDNRFYMPPRPENERMRQLVVNRLGLYGPKSFDPSEEATEQACKRTELAEKLEQEGKAPKTLNEAFVPPPAPGVSDMGVEATVAMMDGVRSGKLPPETLEQHPVFRKIVKQCRDLFGTSISMLTIMDEDRQIFLAETGLHGMREVSRDVTFCAHTVLSGRKGFTILDTHKDWRFNNGPLVQNFNSRFYCGVPLMAPNLDGTEESDKAACPLGTLCVVDDKPRDEFGVDERKKLVYMAEYARREIEKWFLNKMAQKMDTLQDSHKNFVQEAEKVGDEEDESGSQTEALDNSAPVQDLSTPEPRRTPVRNSSLSALMNLPSSIISPSPSSVGETSLKKAPTVTTQGPKLFEDGKSAIKPKMQKIFDLATKLVGDTLDLSLVYLIAVKPASEGSVESDQTVILSGYNLPSPLPVFDPKLHLRALRAAEGGLLYQNPSIEESEEAGLKSVALASNPYASAMIIRVGEETSGDNGGFLLAGFTSDAKRVIGGEDVSYMKQFASELARYTSKLRLQ
ncbi:hypothetical protein DFH28DRAFT_944580 [Melampsora americana]|nr:hypothetical protein DFH28DRAFT_944580 [Melampsora americana]